LLAKAHQAKANSLIFFFFYGFFPHHEMPSFLRSYSIATPSLLHRYSIVSMDNRWIIDGLSMDNHKNEKGEMTFSFHCQTDENLYFFIIA